jgi:hypothetical protein
MLLEGGIKPSRQCAIPFKAYTDPEMQGDGDERDYVSASELAAAAALSLATVWRLKRAGRIPFHQPGGDRHAVRFPRDAIERLTTSRDRSTNKDELLDSNLDNAAPVTDGGNADHKRLPGPRPKWKR